MTRHSHDDNMCIIIRFLFDVLCKYISLHNKISARKDVSIKHLKYQYLLVSHK
jgi:hypothetical protein